MSKSAFLALPAVLALTVVAVAQQPTAPVTLSLEPGPAPVPALKYRLVPDLRDLKSGNAALLYYRSFSPEWQTHRRDPKPLEKLAELGQKRLRDLKAADLEEFRWLLNSRMLQEVDRAARCSYCDWELADRLREEGIGLLLPELQSMREFGNLLRLRARQELLAGKFDKAAYTLQTGLAMARHVTQGPTLIHGLVGAAIATQLLEVVEDWVEHPGAPNLYWALTNLPHPLLDLRPGFQGERLVIDNLFPGYRELLADPRAAPSTGRVQTTLPQYAGILALDSDRGDSARLRALLAALRTYPAAKRFLREHGRSAEQIEAMPVLQVVFLYEVHHYDVGYDEVLKLLGLPYHEAALRVNRLEQRFKEELAQHGRATIVALLLPATEKVMSVPVRLERKAAALRCVEGLRLHAAAQGKFPARLDDVTETPIPLDPWTGKAFGYRLEGGKAVLTGAPLGEEKPHQSNSIRYELTLRAKEKN